MVKKCIVCENNSLLVFHCKIIVVILQCFFDFLHTIYLLKNFHIKVLFVCTVCEDGADFCIKIPPPIIKRRRYQLHY